MKRSIPLASMEKMLKKSGADRVSDKAKEMLREFLEDEAIKISTEAVKFANHAGRKTVKAADIKLAAKQVN